MRRRLALVALLALTAGTAAWAGPKRTDGSGDARPLPFLSDDYAGALAEAKARQLPLFIEAWAPWCHTCRSMRAFVFTDPALASQAGRFVWLELNTDLSVNEPALRRHEADALPTFLVVDPKDEKVVLRWVGSFTVPQAEGFLAEAYEKAKGTTASTPADVALDRADRLYGSRAYAEAAVAYRQALAAAASGWPREARAVEALLYCLQSTSAYAEAVALAEERLPHLAGTPSALIVATGGLDSALELPEQDPKRAAAIAALESALRQALADPRVHVAADDRSSAYDTLVSARRSQADAAGARRVAGEWAAFLEGQAAAAENPDARAVFDAHRLGAYLALGEPERALPVLRDSERALPRDYNPPNRLARVYAALGRWPEALAASSRAEALASGRAKLRVIATRAELLQQKGDKAAALRSYEQAIAFGESLPAAERPTKQIEQLERRRDSLAGASAVPH